ncbi:MAG: putative addiction module antidote protein [Elusimicrobia bacterium]|nr:putative addiction module antidote protein [Elusimicrobiota bacterium]MDE2313608.1 putative addiction module antidote protein [Elusimicrobiota bacterium]
MKAAKNYRESLMKALKDPAEAAEYVNAALEENDSDAVLLALRDVAQARGMSAVSRKAGLNRVSLYRMLSRRGNPHLGSILRLLRVSGLKLRVAAGPSAAPGRYLKSR